MALILTGERPTGSYDHVELSEDVIEERKAVIRRAIDLEPNNPVPLLVQPHGKWYATEDVLSDVRLDLARQVSRNEQQCLVEDYSVPHLKPGVGLGVLAAAFGCEWKTTSDSDAWVRPLISDWAQGVYGLELPGPRTSGKNKLVFERLAYFQTHSSLPLQTCHIPSPLTIASMIWDYSSFLVALIEHPREVHYLLDLVTEATIVFLRQQIAVINNLWGLSHEDWFIPPEYGLRVSDDVLAVISPTQYEEFGVPYNNRLSREFGGIVIHSCGNIAHNIPSILETEGLRGIDCTLPHNHIQALADLAAGKTALMLRFWQQDWPDGIMPNLEAYSEEVLACLGTRGIMLQMEVPSIEDAIELSKHLRSKGWRSK